MYYALYHVDGSDDPGEPEYFTMTHSCTPSIHLSVLTLFISHQY